ncbi:MAG: hypothetical protein IJE97_16215, partial [Thermoguttaceae bacterium]|nr:hypothetical protein [Thermoguttaceae bacterium]
MYATAFETGDSAAFGVSDVALSCASCVATGSNVEIETGTAGASGVDAGSGARTSGATISDGTAAGVSGATLQVGATSAVSGCVSERSSRDSSGSKRSERERGGR